MMEEQLIVQVGTTDAAVNIFNFEANDPNEDPVQFALVASDADGQERSVPPGFSIVTGNVAGAGELRIQLSLRDHQV